MYNIGDYVSTDVGRGYIIGKTDEDEYYVSLGRHLCNCIFCTNHLDIRLLQHYDIYEVIYQ